MKKLAVSSLAVLMLGSTATADAMSSKPSDLKRGLKSYSAVITKKINYVDNNTYKAGYLKKGTRVTIVEREYAFGYDFLYLKGNKVIPLRDDSIKILKAVPGKYDYTKYKFRKDTKQKLAQVSKSNPNYKAYYQSAVNYEKATYNTWHPNSQLSYINQFAGVMLSGFGGSQPPFQTYSEWLAQGKPSNIDNKVSFKCTAANDRYNIDIFSKNFIDHYFRTNDRSMLGIKKGMNKRSIKQLPYSCSFLGSSAGLGDRYKDLTIMTGKNPISSDKITDIYVTPVKKISYKTVIAKYGKPSSTKFYGNNTVEHHLIYNHTKNNGYQVIVALDNKYGNVKYLRKLND